MSEEMSEAKYVAYDFDSVNEEETVIPSHADRRWAIEQVMKIANGGWSAEFIANYAEQLLHYTHTGDTGQTG